MPFDQFDRSKVKFKSLSERPNKRRIERDRVLPEDKPGTLDDNSRALITQVAENVVAALAAKRPVMMTFGAHSIKNGLAPVLNRFIERGWVTHLATNGAGIIHDWEFAFQGETSEDVRANVAKGEFGTWQETGFFLNLALLIGAYEGLGYGESVGRMILNEKLTVPPESQLKDTAAGLDLLDAIRKFDLQPGEMAIPHPFKQYSVQAKAAEMNVPLTGHPMFGHDIIYTHPLNHGAAIGRTAERDFLTFAESVSRIDGGVYISIGSAVMSPMIFEKSLSMAQNVALQEGRTIDGHNIVVVDLAESHWDWSKGEPPEDNPDYYLRYNKTFSRMGGKMRYLSADSRDFLLCLVQEINGRV
jgi:hypothetical protein